MQIIGQLVQIKNITYFTNRPFKKNEIKRNMTSIFIVDTLFYLTYFFSLVFIENELQSSEIDE